MNSVQEFDLTVSRMLKMTRYLIQKDPRNMKVLVPLQEIWIETNEKLEKLREEFKNE